MPCSLCTVMEQLARIEARLSSISERMSGQSGAPRKKRARALSFETSSDEEESMDYEDDNPSVVLSDTSEAIEDDAGGNWCRRVVLTADLQPAFVVDDNNHTIEFRLLAPCPPAPTRRRSARLSASSPSSSELLPGTCGLFW